MYYLMKLYRSKIATTQYIISFSKHSDMSNFNAIRKTKRLRLSVVGSLWSTCLSGLNPIQLFNIDTAIPKECVFHPVPGDQ